MTDCLGDRPTLPQLPAGCVAFERGDNRPSRFQKIQGSSTVFKNLERRLMHEHPVRLNVVYKTGTQR